eukprot:TRINITY_DN31835_c0_g2_i1.p2 TRINITY_DN31835_c0_g2~~TRINITY_DN31835_c0_g2_i1.p2  ORF type:complete len:115 (-),score=16.15 TRINITY_DN31835_c0_g2_i1:152-496(-)
MPMPSYIKAQPEMGIIIFQKWIKILAMMQRGNQSDFVISESGTSKGATMKAQRADKSSTNLPFKQRQAKNLLKKERRKRVKMKKKKGRQCGGTTEEEKTRNGFNLTQSSRSFLC